MISLAVMSERLLLGLGTLLAAVPGLEVLLEEADYRQAQILLMDSAMPGLEALFHEGRTAPFRPLVWWRLSTCCTGALGAMSC